MAIAPNSASLAAALQAGVDPKRARLAADNARLAKQLEEMNSPEANSNLRTPLNLGLHLLAEALTQSTKRDSDRAGAEIQTQIAKAKFPNSPTGQLDYITDPAHVDENRAKWYGPQDVRQGNTLHDTTGSHPDFTAPLFNADGGQFSQFGPGGVQSLGSRPMNYGEQETGRHDVASEGLGALGLNEQQRHALEMEVQGRTGLGIQQQMADTGAVQARAAASQAGTAQGQLGLGQTNSGNFSPPAGFTIRAPR